MSDLNFRSRVRSGREGLGLTREEFARVVGTSSTTIARLELTGHRPNVEVVLAIARLLDTTVEDLFGIAS